MSLIPTTKSRPKSSLHDYLILIYGTKKIGKTSLASRFPDALFFMFEPGGSGLSIYQTPVITDWGQFVSAVDDLTDIQETKPKFGTAVIDTVDEAYKACFRYMCGQMGIEHPQDENDYGKSWSQIKDEFVYQMQRLMAIPNMGSVFLSHDTIREVKKPMGGKYNLVCPSMSKGAAEFFESVVDIFAYYNYFQDRRRLTIQGDAHLAAGHRSEKHFKTKKGEWIHEIDMGESADEAYANLLAAWDNKLDTTHLIGDDVDYAETGDNISPNASEGGSKTQSSNSRKTGAKKKISLKKKR